MKFLPQLSHLHHTLAEHRGQNGESSLMCRDQEWKKGYKDSLKTTILHKNIPTLHKKDTFA